MKKGLLRTSEDLICLLSTRGIDALRPQPTAAYKTRSRPQTQGPNKLSEGNTATVLQGGFLLKALASVHLQHEGELHVVIIGSSTCHPILRGLGLLQHPLTLLVIRSYTTTPNICKVITTA
ncbi:hypothetical protein N7489_005156 [Penicillium chrysogenum]|uniref:Uncharacterized protein n=1 Tax=Penicillium chrysogenum TaxID=5076 RepID=A0ABQ8WQ76_PENCH|nr:uncharacterized protein N7489_005156 [Penicillium chrysogenum]KAJ5245060.1 hypothetical protein N7489_005156 [Penicillium chrysogenum]KAJ5274839.1 hypothetical protein N7505_003384 [Penicillium chrysogenum]